MGKKNPCCVCLALNRCLQVRLMDFLTTWEKLSLAATTDGLIDLEEISSLKRAAIILTSVQSPLLNKLSSPHASVLPSTPVFCYIKTRKTFYGEGAGQGQQTVHAYNAVWEIVRLLKVWVQEFIVCHK